MKSRRWEDSAFKLPTPRLNFTACSLVGGGLFVAGGQQWLGDNTGPESNARGGGMSWSSSEIMEQNNQPAPPIRWLTDPHGWSEVAVPHNSDGSEYPAPYSHNLQPYQIRGNDQPGSKESSGLVNGGCALSLPNGRVLVLGGTRFGDRVEHSLAEYDPQTGAWRIVEEPGGTSEPWPPAEAWRRSRAARTGTAAGPCPLPAISSHDLG